MTTTEELQQLSRDAAGCLPKEWRRDHGMILNVGAKEDLSDAVPSGRVYERERGPCWLHESIEACATIAAERLRGLSIYPLTGGCAIQRNDDIVAACHVDEVGGNHTTALCVCILRALVALKGKL